MMLVDDRVWALFKCHWQHTLTYWSVFFSFGLCIAFLGPTILDLRCQTQSTLQEITWVFFAQQLFLMLGSAIGGLFKKTLCFSLSALLVSSLVISVVFSIIPLCHHVLMLAIAMAISGTAMGVIDTIANLQLVKLYQKDSAVFLQVLHFFIGLGALVSPLVADPFLAEGNCVLAGNMTTNTSIDLHHLRGFLAGKGTMPPNNISEKYHFHTEGVITTKVSYAFWIMGLINLPVPIAVYVLMNRERMFPWSKQSLRLLDKDKNSEKEQEHNLQGHGGLFGCCNSSDVRDRPASYFLLYILGGAVLFITDGIIGSYTGFIYTYAVSPPLSLPHKTAGYLTSVFWASVTAGRLASIYLSYKYTQQRLISISLVGGLVVQCLLSILYSSPVFIFMGTCILGLFISSVFPCMVALIEGMFNYKGCATTVLVTSAGTGEMVLQLLTGQLIHSKGSYSFLLVGLISSCICLIVFLGLLFIQRQHRSSQSAKDACQEVDTTEKSSNK
ncbi:major facilitator superfamily domain-containing protein 4A isoform X1 [Esox lucius]|uniref:major facilitator superfamily domain-containing protein 4A isoform X1 n=1 Tax=Esox lucius TaxID=8010 RepID=UPI000577D903|nr:major facilitator superfamily domain-containing protein 4A isoform X1 [Esox lucius]